MLSIKNLKVKTEDQLILDGINLDIKAGEVHAIMGPNGSGKSTLSKVIAGHPDYEVIDGEILFQENKKQIDLTSLEAYERARLGIFLGFQYPIEVPGVSNIEFMHESFNAICEAQGADLLERAEFEQFLQDKLQLLEMGPEFLTRGLNLGFSGGEKKKNEILQMLALSPSLSFLDETDSGLDIDALKIVSKGVNHLRNKHRSIVLITHYQRLLDYIRPDFVHVLAQGKIIQSGDFSLAQRLEKEGYDWLLNNSK